ncbi:MAG: hypothetical protein ACHQ01_09235 [Candidatus Limnocylindrales bacterium]
MTIEPAKVEEDRTDATADDAEDVEGHLMTLTAPVAWELQKARQQEIARESTRHSLVAEIKAKARRKR